MEISSITIDEYISLSPDGMSDLKKSLGLKVRGIFDVSVDSRGILAIARRSKTRFRFVPGGRYQIGLSVSEEAAARRLADPFPATIDEMRPVISVEISPYLIAESPINNQVAQQILGVEASENGDFPAQIVKSQADNIARELDCRIPTEAQWEVACRAGTTSPFTFGDALPGDDELARWMEWDLSKPMELPANRLGLVGLFFGEWCSDLFRSSYAANAAVDSGSYAVRGGGAFFWPWQDEEWVWCMSAVRMPSSALPEDGRCAARLIFDLQ